jgi:O-antigen/teichoic acid export membrane protein
MYAGLSMSYLNKTISFIAGKLNRSNERSTNAIKNIIASFGIKGISILVSLLLVPMTIHYVNPTQYGIWLTLSSIVGWFSFFDIGFGNGLRNRFAEAKAKGDYAKAKAYVSTTYICLTVIFSVVWLLFFGINFFVDWSKILNAPAQMAKELSLVALIVFSFFCMQIVLKTINTVLIADQKPAKSSFFDMLGQVTALLIIFILTKTTHGSLLHLALALGFCPIVIMVISSFWFYGHEYKSYQPSVSVFDKSIVRDILNLGSKFFLIQIAAIVFYQTTNIIISNVTNPENVTVYNIAYKYFGIGTMIFGIILAPFWSAYTDAFANKDYVWMKNTYKKLQHIAFGLSILTIVLLSISSFVYNAWIGKAVTVPFAVSLIVAIYVITNFYSGLNSNVINGLGKIKLQLILSNITMLINIPLAILLGKQFGIVGVIVPSVFFNIVGIFIYTTQVRKLLNRNAMGILNK